MTHPVQFAPGQRVVVRWSLPGGFQDALGTLLSVGGGYCVVDTRRGPVIIDLSAVVAARAVPPPPAPRSRLIPTSDD